MTIEQLRIKIEELEALLNSGNDFEEVEKKSRELLLDDTLANESELHCRTLFALSESLWRRNMAKNALSYALTALSLAEQGQEKGLQANVLANLGFIYKRLSDYSSALEYYKQALTLREELDNKYAMANIISNIGIVYMHLAKYIDGLEYLAKALALHEEHGNKNGVANNTCNVGIVYANLSDYPRALEYYAKSLVLHEELGNKQGIANVNGNMANVYANLSDYPRALEYYYKALALDEELDNKHGVAINIGNIGNVYMDLLDYTNAKEYYSRALALCEELGYNAGVAGWMSTIGKVYASEQYEGYDPEKAEEFLLNALSIFKELSIKKELYACHKYLADLYEQQERWEDFAVHYKKFHELYLEVQSEEAVKEAQLMEHRRKIEEAERDRQIKLARFQEQEKILDNILPSQITERLIKGEQPIADKVENVSVFFSDIVGFTTLSQKMSAKELVSGLNELFIQYDILAKKHGLEKIKTIGDAYMAVCGVPLFMENHAERTAAFALEIQDLFKNRITIAGQTVNVRIGLHCGEVVAGVIGEQKFAYDLWGDAVNTASRMESRGEAGKIHVSEEFVRELGMRNEELGMKDKELTGDNSQFVIINSQFIFVPRGEMEIKGKGTMRTYFLEKLSEQDL